MTAVRIRPLPRTERGRLAPFGETAVAAEGPLWVAEAEGKAIGYATIDLVPGLPGLYELRGAVRPAWRRQGVGGRLLQVVVAGAPATAARLSVAVDDPHSATGRFLLAHGFKPEHVEWEMALDPLPRGARPALPKGLRWAAYERAAALTHFLHVYDSAFADQPWYQPYKWDEADALLQNGADLLFVVDGATPVGAAWLHRLPGGAGRIEPLGLAPAYRGRGLGTLLLQGALAELGERGARTAVVGLWERNRVAYRLYQRAGFRHSATRHYLERRLR